MILPSPLRTYGIHILLILVTIFFTLATTIYPFIRIEQTVPGASMYGFFMSHTEDYFQYITMIRRGKEAREFLYNNPYSFTSGPPVLVHPFYMLLGHIARIIHVNQFEMYFLARLISCCILITTFLYIVRTLFPKPIHQLIAMILFFTTTATWHYQICEWIPCLVSPPSDAQTYFSAILRLLNLPPHNYVAMSSMMLYFLFLPNITISIKSILTTFFAGVFLSILHPYYAQTALAVTAVYGIVVLFQKKNQKLAGILTTIVFLFSILPYGFYIKSTLIQFTGKANVLFDLISYAGVPWYDFFLALGVILVPYILFLIFSRSFRHHKFIPVLFIWSFVPGVLYYTPIINEAFGGYRLFQGFVQIPFMLLGTQGLVWYMKKYPHWGTFVTTIFVVFSSIYTLPLFTIHMNYMASAANPQFFQYEVLQDTAIVARALQKYTPPNSVVITGERIGSMIPALTHNRVMNGQAASTPNHEQNVNAIRKILSGYATEEEMKTFLKDFGVFALVFGLDAAPFPPQYHSFSFLKDIPVEDGMSIVIVDAQQLSTTGLQF